MKRVETHNFMGVPMVLMVLIAHMAIGRGFFKTGGVLEKHHGKTAHKAIVQIVIHRTLSMVL